MLNQVMLELFFASHFPIFFTLSGITDQGLYRVVGVGSKVQNLIFQCVEKKRVYEINLEAPTSEWEVKTITSGLKQHLR